MQAPRKNVLTIIFFANVVLKIFFALSNKLKKENKAHPKFVANRLLK